MPTLLPFGEGSNERGKQSTRAPARSAGVVGTARRKGGSGNRGRPVSGEGSGLNVAEGNGHGGSRTGSYERRGWVTPAEQRALTFWHASEDGEVKVIGDEPETPATIRVRQWKLVPQGEDTSRARVPSRGASIERPTVVGLVVKPIGKPSAGNRHARFDERGWETGRWPSAPSYRAHPRLYLLHRCHQQRGASGNGVTSAVKGDRAPCSLPAGRAVTGRPRENLGRQRTRPL